jgi:hypothetical protein
MSATITIAVERADTDEVRQLLLERDACFDHLLRGKTGSPNQ